MDKGGAIIIMNKVDYLNKGYPQLNDPLFYREFKEAPPINTPLKPTDSSRS